MPQSFMNDALAEAALARDAPEVPVGCVIVRAGAVIARAGNRTLRDRGHPVRRRETRSDAGAEAKTIESCACEHDRVVITGIDLGEARIHVATHIDQFEIGSQRAQLCLATQR